MLPSFTILASILYVLAMVGLCVAAGTDERTTQFFVLWTGAPYLGHIALAFAHRARSGASTGVFVATVVSGGLATLMYWKDLGSFILAGPGEEIMNCAGPLVEFGVPIVQWAFVAVLGLILRLSW